MSPASSCTLQTAPYLASLWTRAIKGAMRQAFGFQRGQESSALLTGQPFRTTSEKPTTAEPRKAIHPET